MERNFYSSELKEVQVKYEKNVNCKGDLVKKLINIGKQNGIITEGICP